MAHIGACLSLSFAGYTWSGKAQYAGVNTLYQLQRRKVSVHGCCVGKAGRLSPEGLQEALAASSLITVLVQLMGDAALQALEPILRWSSALFPSTE